MPEFDKEEFKFPDETSEAKGKPEGKEPEFEYEIEDDTPSQDRGREPMPKPLVEELEKDSKFQKPSIMDNFNELVDYADSFVGAK